MAEGIRTRHARKCRSREGGRCNCKPSYEAWVYLKREKRKLRKSFPTQAAAKSWRSDALAAASRGRLRSPAPVTVAQAAEELIHGMREGSIPTRSGARYKPAAIRVYEIALRRHVLPELGDVRLSDVRRADVQELADRLTAAGAAASTVQNALDPLRVIYRRAIRRDLVAVDPTRGLELRRPTGRRERIASPDEARALLEALPEEDRALWATALYAGLRRGELRALRWPDVDLEQRVIRVERGWDDQQGEQVGKSRAARRTVPLIARLTPILLAHRLATRRCGEALVFGVTAERPFEPTTVRRRALRSWREAGLEPIGLHEARHTFASLMIAAGGNAKALSQIMGHSTIAITFDQYGHLMPGGEEEARERIDGYLQRLEGGRPLRALGD